MSENRAFFRDTAERILADTLSQADVDAAGDRILPAALFSAFAENGIFLMLIPEPQGGVGADFDDALGIMRAVGEAAAPGPLLETMLGQALLTRAGLGAVDGTIALAFVDRLEHLAGAGTWASPPRLYDLPWGGVADHVLLVGPAAAGSWVALTRGADWGVTPDEDAASEPRDFLSTDEIAYTSGVIGAPIETLLREAAILRGGQILGALEWAFRRSVEYSGERKQFGREISKFQVIQQMLAELADHTLASRGVTEAAAAAMSGTLVAAARSRLADAADAAITISHQVHGALGFSREYALNLRTRRLMAWRDDFGSVLYWRRTLASSFVGCSREEFWPAVADAGLRSAV